MSEVTDRPIEKERLVVDGEYVRAQANEAATIFLAPVSGIYQVITGRARFKFGKARKKKAA